FRENPDIVWEVIKKNLPKPQTKAEKGLIALADKEPSATAADILKALEKISAEKRKKLMEELATVSKIEKAEKSKHEIPKITAKTTHTEFLNIPFDNRLPAITKPPIYSEDVKAGTQITLNFDYDGDGKQDKSELYRKTTAGQILPENVMVVKANNTEYTRKNIKGEFFDENGRRLTIHHNTQLLISEFWTDKKVADKKKQNKKRVQEFVKKHTHVNEAVVKEAIARGIDPNLALLAFSVKSTSPQSLEDAFTEFDRVAGRTGLSRQRSKDGKHSADLSWLVLKSFHSNQKAEEYMEEYGFDLSQIQSVIKKNKILNLSFGIEPALANGPITKEEKDKLYSYFISKRAYADNLVKCYVFFVNNGFTKAQSLGIVANIYHESLGDPLAHPKQYGRNENALGIVQMHPDRRKASGYGKTLTSQLNAVMKEFKSSEGNAYKEVKKASTAREAAAAFCTYYERPGDKEGQSIKRGALADKLVSVIGVPTFNKDHLFYPEDFKKQTRNKLLSNELITRTAFLNDTPYVMKIISGGQEGKRRIGSPRHDHGNAADVQFVHRETRKPLDFTKPKDRKIVQSILHKMVENGISGIGAGVKYMGPSTVHIGGSIQNKFGTTVETWGPSKTSADTPKWLLAAVKPDFKGVNIYNA
ncbi:hypothetical protein CSB09_04375, partial [Candidatus Gracilibacteria bacterium]